MSLSVSHSSVSSISCIRPVVETKIDRQDFWTHANSCNWGHGNRCVGMDTVPVLHLSSMRNTWDMYAIIFCLNETLDRLREISEVKVHLPSYLVRIMHFCLWNKGCFSKRILQNRLKFRWDFLIDHHICYSSADINTYVLCTAQCCIPIYITKFYIDAGAAVISSLHVLVGSHRVSER